MIFDETYKPQKDRSGTKIWRLQIISPVGYRIRKSGATAYKVCVYEALCDCGTKCYITAEGIIKGDVKSCGCLYQESRYNKRLPGDTAKVNRIYATYKRNALNKSREFSINRENFEVLIKSSCTYCGIIPSTGYFNGLDRVDNALGYTKDNSVSCCKQCNTAKSALSKEVFLDLCNRIASKHNINI